MNTCAIPQPKQKFAGSEKNPHTGATETNPSKIRETTVKYCKELLTNRPPNAEYVEDLMMKKELHEKRMLDGYEDDEEELTRGYLKRHGIIY